MTHLPEIAVTRYFLEGGFFMWIILGISIVAMMIALERYLAIKVRYGINGRRLFNEVKKFISAKDWYRALETCRQYSRIPLANVLAAGLRHADQPIEEVETAMESETLYYVPKINERLGYLATLANVATLLGLLGTISGLIAAFTALGDTATATEISKEEALAAGISIAMYTTAFGLIVAIPIILTHMYLANKANHLIDDIDHYATALKQLIQRTKSRSGIPNLQFEKLEQKETQAESEGTQSENASGHTISDLT